MISETCTGDQRSEEDEVVCNDIEHSSAEQRVNSLMISEAGQIFRVVKIIKRKVMLFLCLCVAPRYLEIVFSSLV